MFLDVLHTPFDHTVPPLVLSLKIAAALGFILSAALLILRRSIRPSYSVNAGNLFRQAVSFVTASTIVLLVCSVVLPLSYTSANAPANTLTLILGVALSIAAVLIALRQMYWLDNLVLLRRSKYTNRLRGFIAIGMLGLMMFELYRVISGATTDVLTSILLTLICILFVAITIKRPWLNSFSKKEKLKGTLASFTACIFAIVLLGTGFGEGDSLLQSMNLLLPGTQYILLCSLLFSLVYFVRVGFSLFIALPTAGVVDRKIREVRSLSALSRKITQINDSQELLDTAVKMVRDVCGASSVWIELFDEEGKATVTARKNISDSQLHFLNADGVLSKLLRVQRHGLYVENMGEQPELRSLYPKVMKFARSMVAVPLTLEERSVGTLFAIHREEFAFEAEDVALLLAFADTVSIAIENARLFQSSLEKERFKSELMVARDMQQKLLPKTLPEIMHLDIAAYSSPAFEVGGDYYDFVTLADNRLCIIIGDVSGKGISAAFYMAEVKGIVLAQASECRSPGELLRKVNRSIRGHIDKQSYITMTALAIDPTNGMVSLARAGHTPLMHKHGKGVSLLTPKGFGIGLVNAAMFDPVLEECDLRLAEGDRILLFTDGVNEAQDEEFNELGYAPLETILKNNTSQRAELLLGDVIRQIAEHSGGVAQHDDVTIVTLLCTGQLAQQTVTPARNVEFAGA